MPGKALIGLAEIQAPGADQQIDQQFLSGVGSGLTVIFPPASDRVNAQDGWR
jgi:hypothetical protein